jgi:hypothetical protein
MTKVSTAKKVARFDERAKRQLEHYEASKLFNDTEEAYDDLREKINNLYHSVKSKNHNNYLDLIFEIAYLEEALEVFSIKLNEEYDEMNDED